MNEAEVTLAILAGGRGQRMGKPKALLRVGDEPILTYLFNRFAWRGPTMLVTSPGREGPPGAEQFDREVVDPVEGMGPVRGVITALEHSQTKQLIVASVDMPLIAREQLLWLVENVKDKAGVMVRHESEVEPFPSILNKERAGRPLYDSMRALTKILDFAVIDAPASWPADVWTNLNEPADLGVFLQNSSKNAR